MNTPFSLGRAHLVATSVIREARQAGLPADSIGPAGDLRRFAPEMAEVSLLAITAASRRAALAEGFVALPSVREVTDRTPSHLTLATQRGSVTVHLASPEEAGAALVWHTGSTRHVDHLRARAQRRALRFVQGRLERDTGGSVACRSETELYHLLGLPFIPPELRDGDAELKAAERGTLPNLVSNLHIRGDLHLHTDWSDGRDTLEQMAYAAAQLGYEYIAITDHSERSWASRRLLATDVPRQRAEIEALRGRLNGLTILHGIEVDIMHDGSLDFSDEILGGFDIVLASLHDHGGHDRERLTERYLSAVAHPLVNVITHPANRSPGNSPGYDLDLDRLFAAARETGTALEVDGAPGHLDMDGAIARRAIEAGVTVTIDSDCHRAEALGRQMRFGIGTARRGWVEPAHVLNARSLEDVREFVARKRARA